MVSGTETVSSPVLESQIFFPCDPSSVNKSVKLYCAGLTVGAVVTHNLIFQLHTLSYSSRLTTIHESSPVGAVHGLSYCIMQHLGIFPREFFKNCPRL